MENIVKSVGEFGLYQKSIFIIFGFLSIISSITIYSTVFTIAEPKLICINKDNSTNSTISSDVHKCEMWRNVSNSKIDTSNSYYECYFDRTYYHDTMITDLNLICERKVYATLLVTFYLLGTFSALIVGFFGDRFGRKKTIVTSIIILSITLIFTQLVNFKVFKLGSIARYVINSIAQVITGATVNVIYVVGFILLSELTTNEYCNFVSTVYLYIFVIGELMVLTMAYFSKDWNLINLVVTIFTSVTLILVIYFLPESPRYLIVRKKFEKACELLNKIKKRNQGALYEPLNIEEVKSYYLNVLKTSSPNINESFKEHKLDSTITKKFKNVFKFLLLVFIWFSNNMIYYGVSLGIKKNFIPIIVIIKYCFFLRYNFDWRFRSIFSLFVISHCGVNRLCFLSFKRQI